MDYGAFWSEVTDYCKRKTILMMDLFITNIQLFTSQNVNWWSCVESCELL